MTRMKNFKEPIINSATGTRTRVAWMRAEYPNQLDYSGFCWSEEGATLPQDACILSQHAGTAVVFKHSPFWLVRMAGHVQRLTCVDRDISY